jgi:hypothetical protein
MGPTASIAHTIHAYNSREDIPHRRPLAGIKVVEMVRIIAGPTVGVILASFGADVIPDLMGPTASIAHTIHAYNSREDIPQAAFPSQSFSSPRALIVGLWLGSRWWRWCGLSPVPLLG